MSTQDYISLLKSETTSMKESAFRQALCYCLYQKKVPCTVIANSLKCRRRQVYRRIHRCIDLLKTKDDLMLEAYNEANNHALHVRPALIDLEACTIFSGYNLIIDNENY